MVTSVCLPRWEKYVVRQRVWEALVMDAVTRLIAKKGLVCPRQVGHRKTACSIEPFVDGGFTPPICMDDCPAGPGMAIAPESRIGYCPNTFETTC